MNKHLIRRRRSEARFRFYGLFSLSLAALMLVLLLGYIFVKGFGALGTTTIRLPVYFPENIGAQAGNDSFQMILRGGLKDYFGSDLKAHELKKASRLFTLFAAQELKSYYNKNPGIAGSRVGVVITASGVVDGYYREHKKSQHSLDDTSLKLLAKLENDGRIERKFNWNFLLNADSRMAEYAGILGAAAGSLLTVLICMALALPIGVAAAIYLNEFGKQSKFKEIIEINVANLAAVPSIIYGLLGLVLYLQLMQLTRSSSLVGGLTLALMALPIVIISAKAALSAVPDSIRQGALALGASPVQVVFHHVLPLGAPGIMTGVILAVSRVLGETAPLLMIGMVAFVADVPQNFLDPAVTMPVQVYLWSSSPESGFVSRTSGCIMMLLIMLFALNLISIYIRRKFERRW